MSLKPGPRWVWRVEELGTIEELHSTEYEPLAGLELCISSFVGRSGQAGMAREALWQQHRVLRRLLSISMFERAEALMKAPYRSFL